MLENEKITEAINNISTRAEKALDENVDKTYVEVGILPQVKNRNNQIIYGRRGTGKTHLLRVLENKFLNDQGYIVSYFDCRMLGSARDYNDSRLGIKQRCHVLFSDVISILHQSLESHIRIKAPKNSEILITLSKDLVEKAFSEKRIVNKVSVSEKSNAKDQFEEKIAAGVSSAKGIHFEGGYKVNGLDQNEKVYNYDAEVIERIDYPNIHTVLKDIVKNLDTGFAILIDEWSSLPMDLQPYFAEFVKKTFIPIPNIIVKIAALEHRSNFKETHDRQIVGFEVGSDITSNLDIDDYYVYDKNPSLISNLYSEILYRHLVAEVGEENLKSLEIVSGERLKTSFFTSYKTFDELVRASEGVIRDMILIFSYAYFDSKRRGQPKIDKKSIVEGAREWFEKGKSKDLDDESYDTLRRIVDEVIGNKKARSFLVPRSLEKNSMLQKLFDSRVIHLIKKGYADKDNPGVRYNIYTLDYGTYVDLLNTVKKPQVDLFSETDESSDFVIPFDDKRALRRVILTEGILKKE